ncbi:AzlC family ABC transporter permease [Microbacterium sp. YY-01]|uniref:AzlC family ABC transporter permease n=1 Tax=Microbacterium sp. YY-01 TaxID=3421634 RepID=UPI003D176703
MHDDSLAQRRVARKEALAVVIATSAYGISFGALAVASGLDVWQACVLSLLMFTGGSQFAFIGVLGAGGLAAIPAAIASSALLGVRNAAYGMRLSALIGPGALRRLAAAHFTIDESTAVALAQRERRAQLIGFWLTGIGIFVGWNITTFAGAMLGDLLGDPKAYGLDAAAASAFLALLWPRLRQRQAIVVGVAAAVVAAALTPALMPGMPVLVAALVAVVVGWMNWFSPRAVQMQEQEQEQEL